MTRTTRRPGRSPRATYALAAACATLAAGLLVLGATAQRGLPGSSHYELHADFANAGNLGRFAEVRIAGRRVGQVTAVALRGSAARVRLQLDDDVRPLRAGTTARIRLKGLLGAKFVELRPAARGAALADGAALPRASTSTTVELFDVFAALDEPRRADLRALLRGLGAGFLGRGGQLNAALGQFPPALRDVTAVARAINARPGAARRLVPASDAAAAAFDPVRDELAGGWDPQARALAPLAKRRGDVQATLDAAPPALRGLRDGLAQTDPLLRQTARLARAATRLTRPAPAALRRTTALLRDGSPALRDARTLLRRVGRAVAPTVRLTRSVDPLIAPVARQLERGLPLLQTVARYGCDVLGFARNWRGMLAYGVPSGNAMQVMTALRVTLIATSATFPQIIGDIDGRYRGSRYPPPCRHGAVTPLGEGRR